MGKASRQRRIEEIQRASRVIYESELGQTDAPHITGKLRSFAVSVPEATSTCSGIVIFGRRIRSLVFSTDVATIRNVNADAVFAVYPYTPQQIIAEALIHAADIPVFVGVGGGLTTGKRILNLALYAEMQGASGVVVNAPTSNSVVRALSGEIDIPVVVTAVSADGIEDRVKNGAAIINVAAGAETPQIVAKIRKKFENLPIMATGGSTEESVAQTIAAGANAIVWTPPSTGEVFRTVMDSYRKGEGYPLV